MNLLILSSVPPKITGLTSITNEMLKDKDNEKTPLRDLKIGIIFCLSGS